MKSISLKIMILLCFTQFLWAGKEELDKMKEFADTTHGLLTFVRSHTQDLDDDDAEQALILGIPGFNVKPSSFLPAMDMFAERGHPGLLLHFDGCRNDSLQNMCYENWKTNVEKAIVYATSLASEHNRKLIVFGHSMGGLYAQLVLGEMQKNNELTFEKDKIGLILLAPADGLRSLRQFVGESSPLSSLLPEDGQQTLTLLENTQNTLMGSMLSSYLSSIALGTYICGVHAAQQHLTLKSFQGLIQPAVALKNGSVPYPAHIPTVCVYHENDFLMDHSIYATRHPQNWKQINLGRHENNIQAHTFEYLKDDSNARSTLLEIVLSHFELDTD